MTYFPIAFIAPNYRDYKNEWLKAYEPGTTTPKAMALDSAAAVTVAKLQLNADGFLKSAGGALVIPYLSGAYDLWLFPTEAEADSNTTTNAIRVADNILGVPADDAIELLLINDLSQAYEFPTVGAMILDEDLPVGKVMTTAVHNLVSNDGGSIYIKRAGVSPDAIGSPSMAGAFYAELQGTSGWMSPEVFGSDGTAAVDSVVIPAYLKEIRKQLWKSGKTYILDATIAGGANSFRVYSNTTMDGFGTTIQWKGTTNNGLYHSVADGSLFKILVGGFRMENPDNIVGLNGIFVAGFINYCVYSHITGVGMGQYLFGMGGASSGYTDLTINNCEALNTDPTQSNEFSVCFELFPLVRSSGLKFFNNKADQVGKGGCFKIHSTDVAKIYSNKFKRTTNVGDSQSQAVMIGGRSGVENTTEVDFYNNDIEDANGSLGALFMGNTSSGTRVSGGNITGAGSIIWVGGSISDSDITNVNVALIQSLGVTNAIVNLDITNCKKLAGLNFQAPAGGNAPSSISGLHIDNNRFSSNIRITTAGSSTDITITDNEMIQTPATSLLYADNITFSGNTISISDTWSAGSQPFLANADNYRQFNNIWNLKGLAAQAVWLNGTTDAQVIGETVENTITRVALDNGTASEIFDNRQKINGGAWAVV
jgi:hypothetical protein